MTWTKTKLKDCLSQVKTNIKIDPFHEYKLVTVSKNGSVKLREIISGSNIASEKAFVVNKGNFIYSRLAIHSGAFGIVPADLDGALVTSEMPLFDFENNILPEFLIYSLNLPAFQFQLELLTKGVGRTRVKEKDFLNLSIDLPSIAEQKALVRGLNKIKTLSNSLTGEFLVQKGFVHELHHQLLRDAVMGKLVKQDSKENATTLLAKIKEERARLIGEKLLKKGNILTQIQQDDIPFQIPKNWVWCKLGEIVQMTRGRFSIRPRNDPSYFGGDLPFIQIGSLDERGSVINNAPQTLNERGARVSKEFPKGTIVVAIVGGTIGNLGVLGRDMYFPDSIIGILPSTFCDQEFILNLLRYKQPEIKREAYQMAGQPNIKIPTLENLIIPLPPLNEQRKIVERLNSLMSICEKADECIEEGLKLKSLFLKEKLVESLTPQDGLIESYV